MSAPVSPSQPSIADAPVTILRAWAKAYRDSPEHRFPSDPHAEFFPIDMECAADRIEELEAELLQQRQDGIESNRLAADNFKRAKIAEMALRKITELAGPTGKTAAHQWGSAFAIARAALPQASGVARAPTDLTASSPGGSALSQRLPE